ncbi:hypothetical protein [Sphingobium agri]|jgi:hypothetical protein|uniref:Uncharacterized protein n=2 Tax=Alphaproteobacteria TaxID=28211 RepID=A0ABT0DZE2_9SPHN|nr:hypothetical protein [Sphingobium agri]MCK0532302.1 hypothetical protein [Sphingobium agri]
MVPQLLQGLVAMERIDRNFAALSQRMSRLAMPEAVTPAPQSLASLIDRVNAAKRHYEPGLRR